VREVGWWRWRAVVGVMEAGGERKVGAEVGRWGGGWVDGV